MLFSVIIWYPGCFIEDVTGTYHFMAPPLGEAETVYAAKRAMNISFLHYRLTYCGRSTA
jgi:choline/glycine/proline betaine transport protein